MAAKKAKEGEVINADRMMGIDEDRSVCVCVRVCAHARASMCI